MHRNNSTVARQRPFSPAPKLHLGAGLSAKLRFVQGEATKLRGQLRSEVQLGNESKKGRPHVRLHDTAPDKPCETLVWS